MFLTLEERQKIHDEFLKELAAKVAPPDCLKDAPPLQLWAPEEVEALAAAVADPENPAYKRERVTSHGPLLEKDYLPLGTPLGMPEGEEGEPADISSPLEHIRSLIVGEFPEAATASDEELERLYDLWEKQ